MTQIANNTVRLFLLVVAILMSLPFIVSISGYTTEVSSPFSISAEPINYSSARNATNGAIINTTIFTVAKAPQYSYVQPIESFVLTNLTGQTLTAGVDYVFNSNNGTLYLINTSKTFASSSLNITNASYRYYSANYFGDSGSRSLIVLVPLLCAIGLMIYVAAGAINLTSFFRRLMR